MILTSFFFFFFQKGESLTWSSTNCRMAHAHPWSGRHIVAQPYRCSSTQTPNIREWGDCHLGWLALFCQFHSLLLLRLTLSGIVTLEWGKVGVQLALSALFQVTSVFPACHVQQTTEKDMSRQDNLFSRIKHYSSITKMSSWQDT